VGFSFYGSGMPPAVHQLRPRSTPSRSTHGEFPRCGSLRLERHERQAAPDMSVTAAEMLGRRGQRRVVVRGTTIRRPHNHEMGPPGWGGPEDVGAERTTTSATT